MRLRGSYKWLLAVAGVLLVGGFIIGSVPVGGLYDSESFHCGPSFFFDNSEGYQGTEGFTACRATADARLPLALAPIALGAGLLALALVVRRSAVNEADQTWLVRT
jgi:hypothetical protein